MLLHLFELKRLSPGLMPVYLSSVVVVSLDDLKHPFRRVCVGRTSRCTVPLKIVDKSATSASDLC